MRYHLKALNTNNRDLKSAIVFTINEVNYLFSCPDGFQRIAAWLKLKFGKVGVIFLPSLEPDCIAGLPGFFMSAREQLQGEMKENLKIVVVGPKGTKDTIHKAVSFIGDYWNFLDIVELTENLDEPILEDKRQKLGDHDEQPKADYNVVNQIEQKLDGQIWLGGQEPCKDDKDQHEALKCDALDAAKYPNTYRWFTLVSKFSDDAKAAWTGSSVKIDADSGM